MKSKLPLISCEIISAVIICVIANYYFGYAFTNHDAVIYKIIADGIVKYGEFPYSYAFDHKPAFLYYIYAAFSLIYPHKLGFFTLISLCFYVATAIIVSKFCYGDYKRTASIALGVIVFCFPFLDFSGNTEIFYNFLSLASLLLLAGKSSRMRVVFCAGVLSILAVNTNYMAGVMLSLPTLYLLCVDNLGITIRRCASYASGVAIGLLCVFSPIQLTVGVTEGYLKPQIQFLSAYSEGGFGYDDAMRFFMPVMLSSLLVPAGIFLFNRSSLRINRATIAAVFCFISCVIDIAIARKPFMHYAALFVIPVCLFVVGMGKYAAPVIIAASIPFNIYYFNNTAYLFDLHNRLEASFTEKKKGEFAELHDIIGDNPVLSIRASHVPYYMSNLKPFDRYIWLTHAKQIMGNKEEAYVMDKLTHKPRFVMTGNDFCGTNNKMIEVCDFISSNYHLRKKVIWGFRFGGDIYELN
ncbi:MAG: hypothetical protein E7G60_15320 [Pantoea sp.]|nr:hypothetical protein [Pantoea sp.]